MNSVLLLRRFAVSWSLLLPCVASASTAMPEQAATGGSKPQLVVEESTIYYPVQGRNRAELMQSLRVPDSGQRSRQAHGLTRSDFRVESQLEQGRDACIVRELTIKLVVRIDLPRWNDAVPVPKALQDDWKQVQERTARHEARHRQYALDAANDLYQTLLQRPPDELCTQLAKAMREHSNRVRARWQLRDTLLDQNDVLQLPARPKRGG